MIKDHKVALVTGATGGIGQSIAKRLAKDGFIVVLHYSGNAVKASDLFDEIVNNGGKAMTVQSDVTDAQSVKEMFEKIKHHKGTIDVVVHSAGIMPMARIEPDKVDDFIQVIDTNLIGTFLVLAHAGVMMSEDGRIIAFSSSVVAKNFPSYGPYIASKNGVEGLVRVMANEMAGRNITVNAIAPGPTGTELFYKGKTEEQIEFFNRQSPLGRIGTPEDISDAVAMLAGEDGGWINGQIIRVNGGFA